MYIKVTTRAITNAKILRGIPCVKLTPAILEAIIVENGFTVAAIVPIHDPKKIVAMATIASYPAAMNIGTTIG